MRQFIRHPINIPIEISSVHALAAKSDAYSLGMGGLSLQTRQKLPAGALVHVKIPYLYPAFETDARVVWCRDSQDGSTEQASEVGIEFLNSDDAYRARMMEQICHIDNYRQQVYSQEGRTLSSEDAAMEWIDKFAANFPKLE